ncbi:MAG: cupredoxin domain-containing protein, partial [Actinomycetes bacterium]
KKTKTVAFPMKISGYEFSPLTVRAGQSFTVKNNDAAAHTVTSAAGGFDVSVPGNGQVTVTAPTTAGTYPLTCDFHSDMHGTLIVTA